MQGIGRVLGWSLLAVTLLDACVSERGTPAPGADGGDAAASEGAGSGGGQAGDSGSSGAGSSAEPGAEAGAGEGGSIGDGGLGDDGSTPNDAGDAGPECAQGFARVGDECECDEGWVEEDAQCVRNPCVTLDAGSALCDAHATCEYTGAGQATCLCDFGYDGDGTSCERNACLQLAGEDPPCAANEVCTPTTPGERSCACAEGFAACDGETNNGCESELSITEGHCGACGHACADGLSCQGSACDRRITGLSLGYSVLLALRTDGVVLGAGAGPLLGGLPNTASLAVLPSFPLASAISVNTNHACLTRHDGSGVRCWGSNAQYQVGGADTADTFADLAPGVRSISAGSAHTCIVDTEGDVYCWGSGASGAFGNASATPATRTYTATLAAAPVPLVTDALDVHAGSTITCARREQDVYCWGRQTDLYAPEVVRDEDNVALEAESVCVGQDHGCALRASGEVVCWGLNDYGQLGSDAVPSGRSRWLVVDLDQAARSLTCGALHGCAALTDGSVACWGQNEQGQLGGGDLAPASGPVPVALPPSARAHTVFGGSGALGACAELSTGSIHCWGWNYFDQLGSSVPTTLPNPIEITPWP